MIHSKKVNIAIIVALLAFLLGSYLYERNRIIDEVDFGIQSHDQGYLEYICYKTYECSDYFYKYGLFKNCTYDEQNHIIKRTQEFLDIGAITQDDYDNLMKIYYGGFLLSDYLKEHEFSDYYYFNKFIGAYDNHVGYWQDGERIDIVDASVYENGKPYWKDGEIYIVTEEEAAEFDGEKLNL